ncbi:MAG: glycosyltransferase [Gammaproteobacteria bacterium]|nr:glycosyltransferase [Gammaproteobacteria bacterium]
MIATESSIALILPAYNEALTISDTLHDFFQFIPEARFIVIDNNSSDKTGEIARNVIDKLGISGEVLYEQRQGKGNAVRKAFMEVDADIYVMADADTTYPASHVKDMIAAVLNGEADMVVGDRHSGGHYSDQNKRNFHEIGNNLVKWMVNGLFKADLADIMSGYRVFSRRFVKNYPVLVSGFQIETDMSLHALDKRFVIKEMPVTYQDRPEGSNSKLDTFGDGARVIFTIVQILRYYRPMIFFGFISFMFFLAGLIAGYPVIMDWILYKYIYHVPLAILAAGLEVSAILSLGIGLILDSITHQNKMAFEHKLLSEKRKPE